MTTLHLGADADATAAADGSVHATLEMLTSTQPELGPDIEVRSMRQFSLCSTASTSRRGASLLSRSLHILAIHQSRSQPRVGTPAAAAHPVALLPPLRS